jgi:hypothetical protein
MPAIALEQRRDPAIPVATVLAGQLDDGRVSASSSSRCVA